MDLPGKMRYLCTVMPILLCICIGVSAQPRSVGSEISPFRIGALYQHTSTLQEVEAIHNVSGGVDITGPLFQRSNLPGFYLDYSCNFTILERSARNVVFNLSAGPGVDLGYADDIDHGPGFFMGPMANVAAALAFRKLPVEFSLMLKPTFALHMYNDDGEIKLGMYKHAIMNSCIPQFSIAYRFGHEEYCESHQYEGKPAKERRRSQPLITYGLEWGYIAQTHIYSHFNYVAEGGYRVDSRDPKPSFNSNAQILAHFGFNIGDNFNLAAYGGYQGINRRQRIFPVTLRATVLFGEPEDNGRWLTYAGGGIGLKGSPKMFGNAYVANGGFGYRLNLTRETKLDFLCSLQATYWHPNTFSESIEVRRSNEYLLGLNIGVGISF